APSCGYSKLPNDSEPGRGTTGSSSAVGRKIRPAPSSNTLPKVCCAEPMRTDLSSGPLSSGRACLSTAAAPATCGAAIDVPLQATYGSPVHSFVPAARAATISTPGAVTSGLTAWSPARGPRLENQGTSSPSSTAPTVRAAAAAPGGVTVLGPLPPSLPAATTKSVPYRSLSRSTASENGSVPSVYRSDSPRLMFTTSAPCAAAHSMPAMIHDDSP